MTDWDRDFNAWAGIKPAAPFWFSAWLWPLMEAEKDQRDDDHADRQQTGA